MGMDQAIKDAPKQIYTQKAPKKCKITRIGTMFKPQKNLVFPHKIVGK